MTGGPVMVSGGDGDAGERAVGVGRAAGKASWRSGPMRRRSGGRPRCGSWAVEEGKKARAGKWKAARAERGAESGTERAGRAGPCGEG